MTEVSVSTPLLEWAQQRSGRNDAEMRNQFKNWDNWIRKVEEPAFADLERVAAYTRVPVGMLLLSEPPVEELPIPDFRAGRGPSRPPSGDLLDTIFLSEGRQDWYIDYLAKMGALERLPFVGSAKGLSVQQAAGKMRSELEFEIEERRAWKTDGEARSHLVDRFEALGGLVVMNSMVKNNTKRMLDLEEFRGFTLHSEYAPLVFINANDTLRGQVFSLLHEFAHVWRGSPGISAGGLPGDHRANEIERWCDRVAAEIAVPEGDLRVQFQQTADLTDELDRLASRYHCSTLVVLLKLRDHELIPTKGFWDVYNAELDRLLALKEENSKKASGGSFYNNQRFRVGNKLGAAIARETLTGSLPMTAALNLLAFKSPPVFDKYVSHMGWG